MLEKLKEQLVQLHLELPKNNLVVWTSGPQACSMKTYALKMW
jgi:hypothetical protein